MSDLLALRQELETLLDRRCDERDLSPEEIERLAELLRHDPRLRQLYLARLELHASLWLMGGDAEDDDPLVRGSEAVSTVTHANRAASAIRLISQRTLHRPRLFSVAVAAVTMFVLLSVMTFMAAPYYQAMTAKDDAEGNDSTRYVAQLSGLDTVAWAEGQTATPPGASLRSGQRLRLESGLAEIAFVGAKVVLEGPCEFRVDDTDSGTLLSGKAIGIVSAQGRGFTIETPLGSVVDLGTEFGVELRVGEPGRIEVFVGAVEFHSRDRRAEVRQLIAGQQAEVREDNGQVRFHRRALVEDTPLAAVRKQARRSFGGTNVALIRFASLSSRGNRNDYTGTVGTQFTVGAEDVTINSLGFEDPEGDGLQADHRIGLWNSSQSLVASATVASGDADRFVVGWRYALLDDEVQLVAGETYTLAAEVFAGGDAWTDTGSDVTGPNILQRTKRLTAAPPVNVHDERPGLNCPVLDGQGVDDRVRWAPANAMLLSSTVKPAKPQSEAGNP